MNEDSQLFREKIKLLTQNDKNSILEWIEFLDDKDTKVIIGVLEILQESITEIAYGIDHNEEFLFNIMESRLEPRVIKLLKHENDQVRRQTINTIGAFPLRKYCDEFDPIHIGYDSEEPDLIKRFLPQLMELLEDPNPEIKNTAGFHLIGHAHYELDMGKDYEIAYNIFSKLTENEYVFNRQKVAHFFLTHSGKFPEFYERMTPLLEKLTKDINESVSKYATESLKIIKGEAIQDKEVE